MNRLIVFTLITVLFLFVGSVSWAQEDISVHVDCRASELEKAEIRYQKLARPLLATYAEQYSGKIEILKEKEEKRAKLFREWLNVRCVCKPKGMSRFEKMLCRGLAESRPTGRRKVCLVQN